MLVQFLKVSLLSVNCLTLFVECISVKKKTFIQLDKADIQSNRDTLVGIKEICHSRMNYRDVFLLTTLK